MNRAAQADDVRASPLSGVMGSGPAGTYQGWGLGTAASPTLSQEEIRLRKLEASVLGVQLFDDAGLGCHYSQFSNTLKFLIGVDGTGVKRIKPNVTPEEWAEMTQVAPAGGNVPYTAMITLWQSGDLSWMRDCTRRVVNKVGKFGAAIAGPVEDMVTTWQEDSGGGVLVPMETSYRHDGTVLYWGHGYPKHHGSEGGMTCALHQITYNNHCSNHSWDNWQASGGLPKPLNAQIAEKAMLAAGYGPGFGAAVDIAADYITPPNQKKADLARITTANKEIHERPRTMDRLRCGRQSIRRTNSSP